MTALTRRAALRGAGAAVAVVAVAAPVVQADDTGLDTGLLAQIEPFYDLYRRSTRLWEKQHAHRAQIEAMPDCPGPQTWPMGEYAAARGAFLEAHDAQRYYDRANDLDQQTGAAAIAIIKTPAMTWRGAVEKFKIAHLAIGSYADDGDEALEAYQDWESPWMVTVAADFERLQREAM